MIIQFKTDKTINGDERHQSHFKSLIEEELKRYQSRITRFEVHNSDENRKKEGINDFRCLLEVRLKDKQPIAVTNQADKLETAVVGAIDKLEISLERILGQNHKHEESSVIRINKIFCGENKKNLKKKLYI